MVHNTLVENCAPTDEKELKRISTLEQRVAELENTLLRTATVALEKRVAELEASLKESNEECDKLRKTIVEMESAGKKVIPSTKGGNAFEREDLTSESGDEKESEKDIFESSDEQEDNSSEISDTLSELVSFDDKEAEVIYGRILKLVENMKSDCTKAINLKIPTMSQLPKFPMRQSTKPTTAAPNNIPTPASTPTPTSTPSPSQSRMPGRSRAPSVSGIFTPSRPSTPSSGHQTPSNISNSPTRILAPSRVPSLPSLNGSHVSSRPSTPSSVHSLVNSISSVNLTGSSSHSSPVTPHNLRRKSSSISRPRTPNWPPSCSARNVAGTQSPPLCNGISIQSNLHSNIIPSGIPSNSPSKSTSIPMHIPSMRNCRKSPHDLCA